MLICASDDRTCAQLKEYIQSGADALLHRLYSRTVGKDEAPPLNSKPNRGNGWPRKCSKDKNAKLCTKKPKASLTLTQMVGRERDAALVGSSEDEGGHEEEEGQEEEEILLNLPSDSYYGIIREPLTVIHPLKGCTDPYSLTRVLWEVEPMFVVLYDAELSFVRQLEVYRASRPGKALR